jgi:hypothetical protein
MTKRDSITASRDLRMASEQEMDLPMTLITGLDHSETVSGYTSQSVPIPMPLPSSSSAPNFQTHAPLQPIQWHQRIVHTHAFKLQNWWWKRLTPRVIPVDRPWNIFFNGIVGHVRDRQGNQVDGWHQATQLANYWRRHFGVPEDSHPYHDYNPDDGAESADVNLPLPTQSQLPVPITKLAWLLHSILSQDPVGNDSILSALSRAFPVSPDAPPLSSDSLNHGGQATWRSW